MSTEEEWRPIVGFEGLYEVSDQGRVRSVARTVKRGKSTHSVRERILKPATQRSRYGHKHVQLYRQGKQKTALVSHLVAYAFLGPRPKGAEVCHNDGDASNNRLENLRYGTRLENEADKLKHGTRAHGEKHGQAKLTWVTVRKIRALWATGEWTQAALAKKFDVTPASISMMVRGLTWKHDPEG